MSVGGPLKLLCLFQTMHCLAVFGPSTLLSSELAATMTGWTNEVIRICTVAFIECGAKSTFYFVPFQDTPRLLDRTLTTRPTTPAPPFHGGVANTAGNARRHWLGAWRLQAWTF